MSLLKIRSQIETHTHYRCIACFPTDGSTYTEILSQVQSIDFEYRCTILSEQHLVDSHLLNINNAINNAAE